MAKFNVASKLCSVVCGARAPGGGREGDEVPSRGTPLGTLISSVDRRYTSHLAARSSHGNTRDNVIITRIMTGERDAVRAVDLGFLHPWPHDAQLGT